MESVIIRNGEKYLSGAEMALAFFLDPVRLYEHRKLGIPAEKINGHWYYPKERCHAWFRGEV